MPLSYPPVKPLRIIGIVALLALVGLGAYALGYQHAYERGLGRDRFETRGNLSVHVEELARVRTGDIDGASRLLESSVDSALATLPMGRPYAEQDHETQLVLSTAKTYRHAFSSRDTATNGGLVDVPLLPANFSYCSPAMKRVSQIEAPPISPDHALQPTAGMTTRKP